jgi:hypothetical protein
MNYLENGGNLYIESADIGLNHNNTEFFDYLGLQYIGDGIEQEVVKVKGGPNCLSSDRTFYYNGGYSPHYSIDRLESNGSQLLFSSEDGFGRMFINDDPSYKTISSSILLGAIATGDTLDLKAYIISEMVNTFLGYNPVTSLTETINSLMTSVNYPNPFTEETKIEFNLKESGHIIIDVYDLSGRLIKQIKNEDISAGDHSVTWNATNESGDRVQSGYYFYKINAGKSCKTEKMILLR